MSVNSTTKTSATPAQFVISLDFELHWGLFDVLDVAAYRDNLAGTRNAVASLLRTFVERDIHATWATVGFLFFEDRDSLLANLPARLPTYHHEQFSPYRLLSSLGEDEATDPFHFAAAVIRDIQKHPGQELGTHTFSHYYCLEEGQTPDDFAADLDAARRVADNFGVTLRSLVLPRNQMHPPHLAMLEDSGIRAVRGTPARWFCSPQPLSGEHLRRRAFRLLDSYLPYDWPVARMQRLSAGLVNVPATRFLRPYNPALRWFEPLRLGRILREIDRAAEQGGLYHLWWHPHNFGVETERNISFINAVFDRVDMWRGQCKMQSMTMEQAAQEVE